LPPSSAGSEERATEQRRREASGQEAANRVSELASERNGTRSNLKIVLHGLGNWWNDVELWVLGLPFAFQFAVVMVVLMPVCVMVAWLIDRLVDYASARFGPSDEDEPPIGAK
jgi:hypothetical protein